MKIWSKDKVCEKLKKKEKRIPYTISLLLEKWIINNAKSTWKQITIIKLKKKPWRKAYTRKVFQHASKKIQSTDTPGEQFVTTNDIVSRYSRVSDRVSEIEYHGLRFGADTSALFSFLRAARARCGKHSMHKKHDRL